ncbi:hypothetical protein ACHAPS_006768 [Verticillium nonalfalfae]
MAVAPRPSADRRPSASSVDSFPSTHVDGIPSTLEKKTRLRARNREAAHKCRVRKQRGIEDLQTQEAAIGAVNQNLKNQYAELRSEVILLKDMLHYKSTWLFQQRHLPSRQLVACFYTGSRIDWICDFGGRE